MNEIKTQNKKSQVVFVTDSASGLNNEYLLKHNIVSLPLSVNIGELNIPENEIGEKTPVIDYKSFYALLRRREKSTTSCVNVSEFENEFGRIFKDKKEFVYFAFSSSLSATYANAVTALENIRSKNPEFSDLNGYIVDTKSGALGEGLVVDYFVTYRNNNPYASAEEISKHAEKHIVNFVHLITADDLFFLMRGGRIGAGAAIAGSALGLKPNLFVDEEGKIIKIGVERGRKASIQKLADLMVKYGYKAGKGKIFIAHGDCLEEAKLLENIIKLRFGEQPIFIDYLSPVIGGHLGPGAIALFFIGKR